MTVLPPHPGTGGYPAAHVKISEMPRPPFVATTTECPQTGVSVDVDLEALSARLHDIYQVEAHRRGDVRHADAYADLPEATKEWDRVLARWILQHWTPRFDPADGIPDA